MGDIYLNNWLIEYRFVNSLYNFNNIMDETIYYIRRNWHFCVGDHIDGQ